MHYSIEKYRNIIYISEDWILLNYKPKLAIDSMEWNKQQFFNLFKGSTFSLLIIYFASIEKFIKSPKDK